MKNNDTRKSDTEIVVVNNISGQDITKLLAEVLADYCKAQGFDIYNIYTDDGYTGTNFERPGFRKMMSDIENNGVNLVVVKDLSRFGREHIMVDYYTQRYFPEHNVRFIAISDNVDISQHTLDRFDMMMPIKNVFNEFFPAETSMKVRQAFATKARHGEYMGSTAPYGYKKSPDNPHALIKDEETAPIVKRIFEMAAYEGMGFQKIAYRLFDDRVMTPSALNDMRAGRFHEKNPYQWNLGSHIVQIRTLKRVRIFSLSIRGRLCLGW